MVIIGIYLCEDESYDGYRKLGAEKGEGNPALIIFGSRNSVQPPKTNRITVQTETIVELHT